MTLFILLYCIFGVMALGLLATTKDDAKDSDALIYFALGIFIVPFALGGYLGKKMDKLS